MKINCLFNVKLKMRQLFLLISLFVLPLFGETLYTISKNDTIYSIAKNYSIDIKDIFSANSEIGLNPNFIKEGQVIYLPESKDPYRKICSPYGTHISFITFDDIKITDCIDFLIKNLDVSFFDNKIKDDVNFWNIFFSDIGYSYYLIHKFGEISHKFDTWDEVIQDNDANNYLDIIIEAASKGSELAIIFLSIDKLWAYRLVDKDRYPNNKYLEYSSLDNKDQKDFCELNKQELIESKIASFKIKYLSLCASLFWEEGDSNKSLEFDQHAYESFINYDSSFIESYTLTELVNLSYRWINSQREPEVIFAIEKFIEFTCKDCSNFSTKYTSNTIKSGIYYNAFVDFNNNKVALPMDIWYALHMLGLNYTSAFFELNSVETKEVISNRAHSIKLIEADVKGMEDSPLKNYFKETIVIFNSDTGLKLLTRGECGLAKSYLDPVFEHYVTENKVFSFSEDDIFSEPILLMNCFANKGLELNYDYYINLVNEAEEEFQVNREIYSLLMRSIGLLVENNDSINLDKNTFDNLINDALLYARNSINTQEIDYLKVLISNLYKLVSYIDVDKNYNDLFKLNSLKENFLNELKFLETLSSSDSLQNKILENELLITKISNKKSFSQSDYKKILNLIQTNKELLKSNIKSNTRTSNFYLQDTKLDVLIEKLDANEYIIQFILDDYDGGVVQLISSEDIRTYQIDNRFGIENLISEINESMNTINKFDFLKSNEIYKRLLKDPLNGIPRDSTIYFMSSSLDSLAPYILISDYQHNERMTESEKIFQSNWLIKDYYFVKLDRVNSRKKQAIMKSATPFLGYGNSSTLNWVGLPNLTEVNDEIINLAISSNGSKNNILINNLATKENFLKRIKNPIKKIVISTHAVPKNWLGLTNEPSLVFNSYEGDIFLPPSEIIKLNINTEMIVLSSCNANTQGFNEIPKAFLTAGAETVVYTNWNLESRFSGDFTASFFKNLWYYKSPKHIAMRDTSLKYLNDYSNPIYSHPSYWGNFAIVYSDIN